jgi:hypothetical protein
MNGKMHQIDTNLEPVSKVDNGRNSAILLRNTATNFQVFAKRIVPEASMKPLLGRMLPILRRPKINLLDMDASLSEQKPIEQARTMNIRSLQVELTSKQTYIGSVVALALGMLSTGVQSVTKDSLQYANENVLLNINKAYWTSGYIIGCSSHK